MLPTLCKMDIICCESLWQSGGGSLFDRTDPKDSKTVVIICCRVAPYFSLLSYYRQQQLKKKKKP